MQWQIQGRGAPLFLDQTEGRKKIFFETAPPTSLSEGLDLRRHWDVNNYADRGGCYPTRLKAGVDNNVAIPKQLSLSNLVSRASPPMPSLFSRNGQYY